MASKDTQLSLESYVERQTNPLAGLQMSEVEQYVASMLRHASAANPYTNDDLQELVKSCFGKRLGRAVEERYIKEIIRALRRDYHLPIMASRRRPFGYWWCGSKDEMDAYIQTFKAQALDELVTLSKIVKANYPELAGQLRLELTPDEKGEGAK